MNTSIKYPKINQIIGFIMDGNRRWAKKNIVNLASAYSQGAKNFFMTITECIKYNINTAVFYALSSDNFNKRNKCELDVIYDTGIFELKNNKIFFIENKVKIIFIGERTNCEEKIIQSITQLEEETNFRNPTITIFILMIYDPFQDIFNYHINKKLFYSDAIPNIDLIIRTGGYNRLSGFLPIQSMNANIITLDELWPDLKKKKLQFILTHYQNNQNYGK